MFSSHLVFQVFIPVYASPFQQATFLHIWATCFTSGHCRWKHIRSCCKADCTVSSCNTDAHTRSLDSSFSEIKVLEYNCWGGGIYSFGMLESPKKKTLKVNPSQQAWDFQHRRFVRMLILANDAKWFWRLLTDLLQDTWIHIFTDWTSMIGNQNLRIQRFARHVPNKWWLYRRFRARITCRRTKEKKR